jgi:hypothetical protein
MSLKISSSTLMANHYLVVRSDGIQFCESSFSRARDFRFSEVDCILMSSDHKLSFQVGKEVFSIPTDPNDQTHQTVIAAFVQEIQRRDS